jgi:hypothetical protein
MPTLSRSNTTKWPNGPRTSAVEPGAGSPLGGVRLPTNRVPRRFCVRASGDPRPARSGPRVRRPPSPAADSRRAWHRYRGRSLSLKGDRLPPVGAKRWPNHDQKAGGGRRVGPSPSPRKTMCGPALRSCRAAAHFPYPYDPRTAERLIRFAGLLELAGKTRPPPAPTAVIGRPSRDGDFGPITKSTPATSSGRVGRPARRSIARDGVCISAGGAADELAETQAIGDTAGPGPFASPPSLGCCCVEAARFRCEYPLFGQ